MTTPGPSTPSQGQGSFMFDGASAQILVSLGELKSAVAVLDERVRDIQDHETRLRALESSTISIASVELAQRRSRQALWAAVGSLAGASGTLLTLWGHLHP